MRAEHSLTSEQEQEAARIEDILVATMRAEAKQIAQRLASKSNGELLGQTEFAVREHIHRIGARAYFSGCRCGCGRTPLDDTLQLVDQLTWGGRTGDPARQSVFV